MSEVSGQPVDADVAADPPHHAGRSYPRQASVLAAVSGGGALGALSRYALSTMFRHAPGGMPWMTLGINASGCLLIGVLMVLTTDAVPGRGLLRPFLGVGVLGGYTTFSTYAVDIQQAFAVGAPHVAMAYLALTVALAMLAVFTGAGLTRVLLRTRGRGRRS